MPPRRNRAFSLIEIMLVLAIIGLGLALTASRMASSDPTRALDGASRTFRASLEEMRHDVLLQGEAATLVYDLTAGSCRMEVPPAQADPGAPADPTAATSEALLETTLPEGVRILRIQRRGLPDLTSGELRLRLTPAGGCPAHLVVLGLPSDPKQVRTLRVDPLFPGVDLVAEAKTFDQLFSYLPDDREPVPPP